MGACYNTILVPSADSNALFIAIRRTLQQLGLRVVHQEHPDHQLGFQYPSSQMVFVGPTSNSRWIPLSSWGDGLNAPFPKWYRENPVAAKMSESLTPVVYFFTFDAGFVAGYSIFNHGKQVEAQSLTWQADVPLAEFMPAINPPQPPTRLGDLLGDLFFDYEAFARDFTNLEIATAALANRFGLDVHLLDALDIQDGDGGIVVEGGNYKTVELSNWMCVYYDKE